MNDKNKEKVKNQKEKTKIISIGAWCDYAALTFENNWPKVTEELWKEIYNSNGHWKMLKLETDYGDEIEIELNAHLTWPVSNSFVSLMRDFQDYDDVKHSNWYIIK